MKRCGPVRSKLVAAAGLLGLLAHMAASAAAFVSATVTLHTEPDFRATVAVPARGNTAPTGAAIAPSAGTHRFMGAL